MNYTPPIFFKNPHIQTIFPTLFRKMDTSFLLSERIETPDDDFLDLEWAISGSDKLVLVSHGLEGCALSPYSIGMAKAVYEEGWDALLWNYRSCSQDMNKQKRYYYSGATDDLEIVISHALRLKNYSEIVLCGMSMGGNLSLVYVGEKGCQIHPEITKCATFSVPCDLAGSANELTKFHNRIYLSRFLRRLKRKIKIKHDMYPDISIDGLDEIHTLREFADRYSGPIHGFRDAKHYWDSCSSKDFIDSIRIPTLIVNALDDPFLSDSCYPWGQASRNPYVQLETPRCGGHLGFISFNAENRYWSEERFLQFINDKDSCGLNLGQS